MNWLKRNKVELIAVCAALAYFYWQIVHYFLNTTFYGQGITYLMNFFDIDLVMYLKRFVLNFSYYPPVYYAFFLACFPFFHFHFVGYVMANALFIAAGGMYLYLLLREKFGRVPAYCGLLVFLFVPGMTIFSKALIIEAPLLLFVPAFLFHFNRVTQFKSRGHSIALGVFAGLGMLTKWTFAAYVGPIALYYLLGVFFDIRGGGSRQVSSLQRRNMILAFVTMAVLAGPWYLFVFDYETFRQTAANDPRFARYDYWQNLVYNWSLVKIILGRIIPQVFGIVFLVLFVFAFFRAELLVSFALMLAVPMLVFSIPVHLEDRYLLPLVPFVAYMTAAMLGRTRFSILKYAAIAALIVPLGLDHARAYYPPDNSDFRDDDPVIHRFGTLFWGQSKTEEIISYLDDYVGDRRLPRKYQIATHPLFVNYHTNFVYLTYFIRTNPRYDPLFRIAHFTKFRYSDFSRELGDFDFLLYDVNLADAFIQNRSESLKALLSALQSREYVDQNTGQRFDGFSLEMVTNDLAKIEGVYKELKTIDISGAYKVRILVNRRMDSQFEATPPEEAGAETEVN